MIQAESDYRRQLNQSSKVIVVKVGSRILTNNGRVDLGQIQSLARQLAMLQDEGRQVCLVSSGAVGTAMTILDTDRPIGLGSLQAYAAIGQAELIHHYNREFEKYNKRAAQVLLTLEDMSHRQRYLNLRNTIFSLFDLGAIPIINENDCVATEEIAVTFGDNDRLAANVAMLVDADLLVILSDVDAVYDQDPEKDGAKRVSFVEEVDETLLNFAQSNTGSSRSFSKGGMHSKLQSARIASSVGIPAIIAGGREPEVLGSIVNGKQVGTLIAGTLPSRNQGGTRDSSGSPRRKTTSSRKRWIKSAIDIPGSFIVDQGASQAVCELGKSLLPIGILSLIGEFDAGDLVRIVDEQGKTIGKGISNYSSTEAKLILGCRSAEFVDKLGRVTNEEMIHRDNLVLE